MLLQFSLCGNFFFPDWNRLLDKYFSDLKAVLLLKVLNLAVSLITSQLMALLTVKVCNCIVSWVETPMKEHHT